MIQTEQTDAFLEYALGVWRSSAPDYFGLSYQEAATKMFASIVSPDREGDVRGFEYDWYAQEARNARLKDFGHIVAVCDGRSDALRTGMLVNLAVNGCLHRDLESLLECWVDDLPDENPRVIVKGASSDFFGVAPLFEHLRDLAAGLPDGALNPKRSISLRVLAAMAPSRKRRMSPSRSPSPEPEQVRKLAGECPRQTPSPRHPSGGEPAAPKAVDIFPPTTAYSKAHRIRVFANAFAARAENAARAREEREENARAVLDKVVPVGVDLRQDNAHATMCALLKCVMDGISPAELCQKLEDREYAGVEPSRPGGSKDSPPL